MDRVLRQHPEKYDAVRRALNAFRSSSKPGHNVARYFNCVFGEGMMLPDCTMLIRVKESDIRAYLKRTGLRKLKAVNRVVENAEDGAGFRHRQKAVEKVVCDPSVFRAVNHLPQTPAKAMDMKQMATVVAKEQLI